MFVNFANNYHFLKKRPMYSGAIRLNLGMKSLLLMIVLVSFSFVVISHVEEKINERSIDVDVTLKTASTNYVLIASAIAGILVVISIAYGEKIEKMKMLIFLGIIISDGLKIIPSSNLISILVILSTTCFAVAINVSVIKKPVPIPLTPGWCILATLFFHLSTIY